MNMFHPHGIEVNHNDTTLLAPKKSLSAFTVVVGCAPIHRLSPEMQSRVKSGKIEYVSNLTEAGTFFGIDTTRDNFEHWTLSEAAFVFFQIFQVSPLVFVNLFDPEKHKKSVASETVSLLAGVGRLAFPDVIGDVTLTSGEGESAFIENEDYFLNRVTGEITALEDGNLVSVSEVTASYSYAAPEMVDANDCIGGFDVVAGTTTGISLIDDVFAKYSEVPTIGLASKFGEDPGVAAVLSAKMDIVSGMFLGGIAPVDVPSDGENAVASYTDVPEYKNRNGLTTESTITCWPKTKLGGRTVRMSVVVAARMAATDADNGGIPYVSPSNQNIFITGLVANGEDVWLDPKKASLLDGNGIVTALRFKGGWRLWGNHTAAYPASSDPKEYFIPIRRMLGWYGNQLLTRYWDKIDKPLTRVLIESIVNSEQYQLNTLVASHVIYGGEITLPAAENNITDLMSGKVTFRLKIGFISPAELIVHNIEYDPSFAMTVFTGIAA